MIEWLSASELADLGLPGLPATPQNITTRAKREAWESRKRQGRGGGLEYHYTSLPERARAAWLLRTGRADKPAPEAVPADEAWAAYEAAGESAREEAEARLNAVMAVEAMVAEGAGRVAAVEAVAAGADVSPATLRRWIGMVRDVDRKDRLAHLTPRHVGRVGRADCDPAAWDWYMGHYLTRRQPSHADTYRRLEAVAASEGWSIPSARTLARRLEAEVDALTITLMREGVEAVARKLPRQRRDETVFAAGEAVNGDGLKFDKLWVRFEDGEILNTATAWIFQDIRTRRILAHRVGKTENTDLFRLATYDLTAVCAPALMIIDNTRVAANKLMTSGAKGRHRFKDDKSDGVGLLVALGIVPQFTNPDKETGNPGAKPIERAFGIGGLHDAVATHPRFTDRGYSKATAIGVDELRAVLAEEIARHNAQPKRRTTACRGVLSFDEAWAEAVESIVFRKFSERQRRMLLMVREVVRVDQSGAISLKAGRSALGRNRYWSEAAARCAGQKVVAHFDPDNLSAGIHAYALDGRYLFAADYLPSVAFNSTTDGREWSRHRHRKFKALKKAAEATSRMDALGRAALYAKATEKSGEEAPEPPERDVVAAVFGAVPNPDPDAAQEEMPAPVVIDFTALAARQSRAPLLDEDEEDEEGAFLRSVLEGARRRGDFKPGG